jgi:endonuclease YncB( thermonuclease family)
MNMRLPVRNLLKIHVILTAFLFLSPTVSLAGQFKVTRVYDGDTVKAEGHDIEIKVRLVGIDTPETSKKKRQPGQPYSQKAKEYLAGLILNKTVDIKGYGMGPYNRILGVIYLDGKNINLEMVKAGLAEVYRGIAPHKFNLLPYWQAEKKAKDDMKGMWSLGDKYVSPKVWRKMQRKK